MPDMATREPPIHRPHPTTRSHRRKDASPPRRAFLSLRRLFPVSRPAGRFSATFAVAFLVLSCCAALENTRSANAAGGADPEGRSLVDAVNDSDEAKVIALLKEHPKLAATSYPPGVTPLHWWAMWKSASEAEEDQAIFKALLAAGASLTARNRDGATPIGFIVRGGTPAVIATAFEALEDVRVTEGDGRSLLHIAVARADVDVVRMVIDAGVDINQKDNDGWTPFAWAAKEARANAHENGLNAEIDVASQPVLRVLEQHGAKWDPRAAVLLGNVDAIADLVAEDKVALAGGGQGLLHLAARFGIPGSARKLLELGATLDTKNDNGITAMDEALLWRRIEVVRAFIEHGGATASSVASIGDAAQVEKLIEADPDRLDVKDGLGRTPLMWGVYYSNVDTVAALIDLGADVAVADHSGCNAGHYAAGLAGPEIVDLLAAAGMDFSVPDAKGWQPIHHAAAWGNVEAAIALLRIGVDIDARDKEGNTPLHRAASFAQIRVLRVLLEHGADRELFNRLGLTALDEARRQSRDDAVEILTGE